MNDLNVDGSSNNCQEKDRQLDQRNTLSMLYAKKARKVIMSTDDYHQHIQNHNSGQCQIVMYNQAWCKAAVSAQIHGRLIDGFHIFLSEPGGTGKSHIIQLIRCDVVYSLQQTLLNEPDQPLVLLTAPTGCAAFNIGGKTIHFAFMLQSDDHINFEKSTMQVKLSKMVMCVIDKVSMVGSPKFQHVSSTPSRIKGRPDTDWGIYLLAVGDLCQLPPVGQQPVYACPKNIKTPSDLAPLPWDEFYFHGLTQIMHQKNVKFANMLNSIRQQQPEKDLHEDMMLQSCELQVGPDVPSYPTDAMHVYSTNEYCSVWNNSHLELIQSILYTSHAFDISKDQHT